MATSIVRDVTVDDFSSGVYDDESVADSLMPPNACRHGVNVQFNVPRGAVSQRLGTTVLGDQAGVSGSDILGIHNFRSPTSANNKLIIATNSVIRYLNGSTWTNIVTGLTSGLKTRFITYLNRVALMNGTDGIRSWDGTAGAWLTTGGPLDVADWPVTKLAVLLNGRILALGDSTNPSQIYESSLQSAGTLSWDSGNRNTQIFPNDGNGDLTSAVSNGRVAILFKERAQYRYDGNSVQYIAPIGTTSHESVMTDDEGVTYFFGQGANSVGFYATTGGYPKKISRPIQKWVEAISASFYDDVAGYTDGTSVYWSIGSVTIDGTTYTNASVVYNLSDRTWECRSHADRFLVYSQYINGSSELTIVGGDTDGYIQTMDSGNTDNGTNIVSEFETGPLFFTGRGRQKAIPEIIAHCSDIQNMSIHARVDGILNPVGGVTDKNTRFQNLDLRGRKFNMKMTCSNSGVPFVFDGFSFPIIQDEGFVY